MDGPRIAGAFSLVGCLARTRRTRIHGASPRPQRGFAIVLPVPASLADIIAALAIILSPIFQGYELHIIGNFPKHSNSLPRELEGLEAAVTNLFIDMLTTPGGPA